MLCEVRAGPVRAMRSIRARKIRFPSAAAARRNRAVQPPPIEFTSKVNLKRTSRELNLNIKIKATDNRKLTNTEIHRIKLILSHLDLSQSRYG